MPVSTFVNFGLGTLGVAITLWLTAATLSSDSIPVVGTARGTLIAMAAIGMVACAVAGIGQAPVIGWSHPISVIGTVFGIAALITIGAGLVGWDGLLRPAAALVPAAATVELTTERLAIAVLAAIISLKWVVGIALAVVVQGRS
jgi:hypothetical protein